jgi:hypothetical protein
MAAVFAPLHIVWFATGSTVGIGLTTTVAVIAAPVQPLAVGVIVNVTVTGAAVVLVNVPLISPLPLAAIPVTATVLSLVQLKVVPLTAPVNTIGVIADPEHIDCDDGVATASGVGFTVMVNEQVAVLPVASVAVAVTVVVPTVKTLPDAGIEVKVTPGQLSLAVGAG